MRAFKLSKPQIIFIAASFVLLFFIAMLTPKTELPKRKEISPIRIAVAADPHYIAPELTDGGEYFTELIRNADGKAMMYCEEISDAFASRMITEKPDALVILGDLTFNGERESHEAFEKKLDAISDSGVRVFVLPGNHDINNPDAAKYEGSGYKKLPPIVSNDFSEIYDLPGYDDVISYDADSLSYCAALSDGLWALMIDTNNELAPRLIKDDTLRWVRKQLEAARKEGINVISFTHQSVLAHNSLFTYGFMIDGSEKLLELYEEFGVICNFCGHMHLQHIAKNDSGFTEISMGALVTAPCYYGILELDGTHGQFEAKPLEFAHAKEAKQFFLDSSYWNAESNLKEPTAELCAYFAEVNYAYFSGRCDRIDWRNDMYQQYISQGGLIPSYLKSIKDDGSKDSTKCEW